MKKVDFLILYEYRARELNSMCLLKYELEKRGYSVYLSNIIFFDIGYAYNNIEARVIVVPYFYEGNNLDILLDNFRTRFSFDVVNMQCEQVLTESNRLSGYYDIRGIARKAYHICWGKYEKNILIENGIDKNKCLLTGSINSDFDREQFRMYFFDKIKLSERFKLDCDKKWILFISSFSYTTMTNNEINDIKNRTKFSHVDEFKELSISSKETVLKWFEKYLIENSEVVIIYRPHPSERNDENIRTLENRFKNFRIISDYSVQQWILVSDIICNWFSTSFADAYFLGKSCYSLRPLPIPKELEAEILVHVPQISDFYQFEKYCKENKHSISSKVSDTMDSYYFFKEEIPAYINICDELINILRNATSAFETKGTGNYLKNLIKSFINKLSMKIPLYKYLGSSNRLYYESMFKENHNIKKMISSNEKRIDEILKKTYEK